MDTFSKRPLDLFEGIAEAFFVGLGDGRRTGVGAHAVEEEIDVLVVFVQFVFFEEIPHLGVGQGAHVLDAVLLYLSPEFVVHLFGDVCALLALELLKPDRAILRLHLLYVIRSQRWLSSPYTLIYGRTVS